MAGILSYGHLLHVVTLMWHSSQRAMPVLQVCVAVCAVWWLHMFPGRSPRNVKALLRAAQATVGLGAGEYDAAAQLLQQALDNAKQQQLPTRGEQGGAQHQTGHYSTACLSMMLCLST